MLKQDGFGDMVIKKLLILCFLIPLTACDSGSTTVDAPLPSPVVPPKEPTPQQPTSISGGSYTNVSNNSHPDFPSNFVVSINTTQATREITVGWSTVADTFSYALCEFDPSQDDNCSPILQGNASTGFLDLTLGENISLEQLLAINTDALFLLYKEIADPSTIYDNTYTLFFNKTTINNLIQYIKASNPGSRYEFGSSVAISNDGTTLAVGSRYEGSTTEDPPSNDDSGAVYIYSYTDLGWRFDTQVKYCYPNFGDEFGKHISMNADGTVIAASIPEDDADSNSLATVSITTTTITVTTSDTDPTTTTASANTTSTSDDCTGASATLQTTSNGNTVTDTTTENGTTTTTTTTTSSTPTENNNAPNSGAIAILVKDATDGEWQFEYIVKSETVTEDMQFGTDAIELSSDGNTLAVGHYSGVADSTSAANQRVEIFTRTLDNSSGTTLYVWNHSQTLTSPFNTQDNDNYGYSLAFNQDASVLAVGATLDDSATASNPNNNALLNSGSVYIYTLASGSYTQSAYVKPNVPTRVQQFGTAVDLSADGTILAVGAEESNEVYVFQDYSGSWLQEHQILSTEANPAISSTSTDKFGHTIALSSDASKLIVGAIDDYEAVGVNGDISSINFLDLGIVYLFELTNSVYTQNIYVKPTIASRFTFFGSSIESDTHTKAMALSGDGTVLAVGAPGDDIDAIGVNGSIKTRGLTDSGAAYVFYF